MELLLHKKCFEPWFAHRSPKYPRNIRFKVYLVLEWTVFNHTDKQIQLQNQNRFYLMYPKKFRFPMTAPRATFCTDKKTSCPKRQIFRAAVVLPRCRTGLFYEKQTINVFLAIKQLFNLKIRKNVLASDFILQCDLYCVSRVSSHQFRFSIKFSIWDNVSVNSYDEVLVLASCNWERRMTLCGSFATAMLGR